MIGIKVVGAQRVGNRYRTAVSQNQQIVEPEVRYYVKSLQKELSRKKYPPKPLGSKYIRTGRLGSRFSAKKIGKSSWGLFNSAPYAAYVIDQNKQAGIHQGRWYTIQEIEQKRRAELTAAIVEKFTDHVSD